MIIEELALFGIFVFLLYVFAESKPSRIIIGVLASCLLILLGFSIVLDGVQITNGQIKTITTTGTNADNINATLIDANTTLSNVNGTASTTALETATNTYASISALSTTVFGFSLSFILGCAAVLFGIIGMVDYSLRIGKTV